MNKLVQTCLYLVLRQPTATLSFCWQCQRPRRYQCTIVSQMASPHRHPEACEKKIWGSCQKLNSWSVHGYSTCSRNTVSWSKSPPRIHNSAQKFFFLYKHNRCQFFPPMTTKQHENVIVLFHFCPLLFILRFWWLQVCLLFKGLTVSLLLYSRYIPIAHLLSLITWQHLQAVFHNSILLYYNNLEYNYYKFSDLIGQNSASKSFRSSQVY